MGNVRVRGLVIVVACLMLLPKLVTRAQAKDPKLTVEDVIAKSLDALAPADARANCKNRVSEFQVKYRVTMGGQLLRTGVATLASEGQKLNLTMRFPVPDMPGQHFIFDGKKFDVAYLNMEGERQFSPSMGASASSPGATSSVASSSGPGSQNLATFVQQENEILREGLLGGVLSTAWPLFDVKERQAKVKYDGLKKENGVDLHRLTYWPKKVNNAMQTQLFFDPVTFRHVKTLYLLELQPPQQSITYTGRAGTRYTPNERFTMEEEFSDFQTVDGVTLPTHWTIRYTYEPPNVGSARAMQYDLSLTRVGRNINVPPKIFEVQ